MGHKGNETMNQYLNIFTKPLDKIIIFKLIFGHQTKPREYWLAYSVFVFIFF